MMRIGLLACVVLVSSMPSVSQQVSLADRQADFKTFVHDFEDSYAYLNRAEKPWLTWQERFGPAAEAAGTKVEFAGVLADALSELHDFHAEVRSRTANRWLPVPTFADVWADFQSGEAVVTAVRPGSDADRAGVRVGDRVRRVGALPVGHAVDARLTEAVDRTNPAARQWGLLSVLAGRAEEARTLELMGLDGLARTVTLPVERRFDRPAEPVTSRVMDGNVGLIRLNNSLGEQRTVAALDAALERIKATKGLVLDLRDVPSGGDSSVALGIMGRFVQTMLPYQRHRIPNYGQADVERNWIEQVAPRGPFRYAGPLVVLVDHWTGSMGEGMAIGFDGMGRGRVMGTTMAHLAGAVSDEKLPKTGVDVAWATEQLFHVNGTPRQVWTPPELVGEEMEDQAALLARAVEQLKRAR